MPTIQRVGDVANRGVKIIGYGQAKVGKTYQAAYLQGMNPLILSTEFGLLTLQRLVPDMHVITVSTYQDFDQMLNWALLDPTAIQTYGVIIIDGITDIAEVLLAEEKMRNKDGRKAYGEMGETIIPLLWKIRNAERHVYMTAKEGQVMDGDGILKIGPSMPGKALSPQLPYLFDEILHLNVSTDPSTGQRLRWFRTTGDTQYIAGDRSGALDPNGEPADLSAIFAKILGTTQGA
jgi:hypothetical protein